MNECIHAGWTTGIPSGQELDRSVSQKKKKDGKQKVQSFDSALRRAYMWPQAAMS